MYQASSQLSTPPPDFEDDDVDAHEIKRCKTTTTMITSKSAQSVGRAGLAHKTPATGHRGASGGTSGSVAAFTTPVSCESASARSNYTKGGLWTCTACTFCNENPSGLACTICGTTRWQGPPPPSNHTNNTHTSSNNGRNRNGSSVDSNVRGGGGGGGGGRSKSNSNGSSPLKRAKYGKVASVNVAIPCPTCGDLVPQSTFGKHSKKCLEDILANF